MITPTPLTQQNVRGGRLAAYYVDGLDDYFAKEGLANEWQGLGAERLGLVGEVDGAVFKDLLHGRLPTGEVTRLSKRDDANARVGIDLTFSPPKSISLQALVGMDAAVVRAHDEAVTKTLHHIEQVAAQARKKVDGKTYVETTGNLVVAKFRHETNRELEPQLHTHAVVLNITQREDGAWRALVNDLIVKNAAVYDAMYQSELAMGLERLGFELRREGNSFELAHITREQLLQFSTRAAQIVDYLADRGHTRETASASLKRAASMATRKDKDHSVDRAELAAKWKLDAIEAKIDFGSRSLAYSSDSVKKAHKMADRQEQRHSVSNDMAVKSRDVIADNAVAFALNHLTERRSIVGHTQVTVKATQHALGKVTTSDIAAALDRAVAKGTILKSDIAYRSSDNKDTQPHTKADWIDALVKDGKSFSHAKKQVDLAISAGRLIPVEPRYTTQRALDREQRILKRELSGRSVLSPIMQKDHVDTLLSATTLRDDQRRAVTMALTTENKISGWQGLAGVGKSYALNDFKRIAEDQGYKVVVLAPYGSQVKSLRKDGIEAQSVASYLISTRRARLDDKTIVCVDESGVIPTRLMDKLTSLNEREGGRLLLIGDVGQTKSIEEGSPFKLLQRAGMELDYLDQIQRQKNSPQLAEVVRLAANGKAAESVSKLGNIEVYPKEPERLLAIAKTYVDLPPVERTKTLVVTGTNQSRRMLNYMIREALEIKTETTVTGLTRHDSTQAERRHAHYYNVGDIVQPERDYKSGLKRGELYTIADTSGNRLTLKDAAGEMISISPAKHRHISVYKPLEVPLGTGDMVRITRNNAALDLANGDLLSVKKITNEAVVLTDGNRYIDVPREKMMHFEPGYVTTVHSSQGLTADRVLGNIDTPSRTVADDWYYVLVSRAKHSVQVFTDNLSKLPKAVARKSIKHAAIELEHKKTRKMIKTIEQYQKKGKTFSMK